MRINWGAISESLVVGVGLAILAGQASFLTQPIATEMSTRTLAVGVFAPVSATVLIIVGGIYTLYKFRGEYGHTVLMWVLLGISAALVISTGTFGYMELFSDIPFSFYDQYIIPVNWISVGALGGLVVGHYNSRQLHLQDELREKKEDIDEKVDELEQKTKKLKIYANQLKEDKDHLREKNHVMDSTARMISHDLQNPLSIAHGVVSEVEKDYHGDSQYIYDLKNALDRMDIMLDEIVTLVRSGKLDGEEEYEQFSLTSAVYEAWEVIPSNGTDNSLELDLDGDMKIEANRTQFIHLLQNLFRNAVDHTEDDVTVSVGGLQASTEQTDITTGFYIADDGEGIPPNIQQSVFDSGMTTSDDGTGLGLAIVQRIVNAHDWTIDVESSAPGGARFNIRFEPDNR